MSEASAVQNLMLRYADRIGWHYISRTEALHRRGGAAGLYFTDIPLKPNCERNFTPRCILLLVHSSKL